MMQETAQKADLMDFWRQRFNFGNAELKACQQVKREDFIPRNLRLAAYEDMPLPLLRGKTISQPTTVMIMTSALQLERGDKVFEIGTGSGYQAAIIANIVGQKGKVITTEVVPELVHLSRENLKKAKINNVIVNTSCLRRPPLLTIQIRPATANGMKPMYANSKILLIMFSLPTTESMTPIIIKSP